MRRSSLFLLLAVAFWGLSFIAIKVVLTQLTPVEMISARFLMAAPVLFVIIRIKGLQLWPVAEKPKLAVAALIIFVHFWIMATGMKETSASAAAWLLTSAPIFIALLAWLWLGERFAVGQWLGVALAVCGVVVLTANGRWSNLGWIQSRGDLIVFSSCVTWALYTVVTRDVIGRVNPMVATFWMTALAGLVFVPYTLIVSGPQPYFELKTMTWLSLLFLGVFCLAIAFWLWAEGLSRQSAAEVGVYLYIEPLFATLFAWVLLREPVTLWLLLGAALISLGVYTTDRFRPPHPPESSL